MDVKKDKTMRAGKRRRREQKEGKKKGRTGERAGADGIPVRLPTGPRRP